MWLKVICVMKTVKQNFVDQSAELSELEKEWRNIDWRKIERDIFKIQQRIFQAEAEGDKRQVKRLSRLLLHDKRAKLLSIREVTQKNGGKSTPGIDGKVYLTDGERMKLFYELCEENIMLHKVKPVRRVYIPKKNGKMRPLGIPTIKDRIYQNICKLALEPIWENRFESTTYGFRPLRSQKDAIAKIYDNIKYNKRQYIFEGDFEACFDNLNHDYIMEQIGNFPLKHIIHDWLKAGYIHSDNFYVTESGTPQGGIISPLLANIALHGMEDALNIKYERKKRSDGSYTFVNKSKYTLIKYADDFVVLCKTKSDALKVYELLEPYLEQRGLTLSKEKTKITHLSKGFDFLGVNFKSHKTLKGYYVMSCPSKDSIKSYMSKARDIFFRALNGDLEDFIISLNNLTRGTANYWAMTSASKAFHTVDFFLINRTRKLLHRLYPKKSHMWIKGKHFKPDRNGKSKDNYIFTNPETGSQLLRMGWFKSKPVKFPLKYGTTPYDKDYWEYIEKIKFKPVLKCLFG